MACDLMPQNSKIRWLQLVFDSQSVCGALSDNHAGSHGVAGCHARHDGSIRDTKVLDAIHPETTIDHRHRVAPHFGGGCLMPKAERCATGVVLQFWALQVAGHDLSLDKGTKSAGVTYFATEFHAGEYGFSIIWV